MNPEDEKKMLTNELTVIEGEQDEEQKKKLEQFAEDANALGHEDLALRAQEILAALATPQIASNMEEESQVVAEVGDSEQLQVELLPLKEEVKDIQADAAEQLKVLEAFNKEMERLQSEQNITLSELEYYKVKGDGIKYQETLIALTGSKKVQAEATLDYIKTGAGQYTNRDGAQKYAETNVENLTKELEAAKEALVEGRSYLSEASGDMHTLIKDCFEELLSRNEAQAEARVKEENYKSLYPTKFDKLEGIIKAALAEGDQETLNQVRKLDGKTNSQGRNPVKLPRSIKAELGMVE